MWFFRHTLLVPLAISLCVGFGWGFGTLLNAYPKTSVGLLATAFLVGFLRLPRESKPSVLKRLALSLSHLTLQIGGIFMLLPFSNVLTQQIVGREVEWIICVLMLLLLPVSVYLVAVLWVLLCRSFATADEMMEATGSSTDFDKRLIRKLARKPTPSPKIKSPRLTRFH
jgi:hypothetical protein